MKCWFVAKVKMFAPLYAGLIVSVSVSRAALAAGAVNLGVTADFYSKYIWRGQNFNDRNVLQPAISVKAFGFTGSIWGNLDLTNKNNNEGDFSEFDYTLDYTAAMPVVEGMSLSAGTVYYRFPNTPYHPTTEIYGGLSLGVLLSPSIKWYRDIEEIDGSYLQLGLGHTFEKLHTWTQDCYCDLEFGASAGWGNSAYNRGYFGINQSEFNDLTLSAGLPVCIGSWSIKPSLNYSTMLNNVIRNATAKSDNIWVGIGLQKSL